MLTPSEREWLFRRKLAEHPFCGWCMKYALCFNPYFKVCPTRDGDMQDAAEFSERVAAKLALGCESQLPCNGCWRANWKFCNLRKGYWDCADCFLKTARLIVEEEMDG